MRSCDPDAAVVPTVDRGWFTHRSASYPRLWAGIRLLRVSRTELTSKNIQFTAMPRPLTAELSLRHLPDISDTSFQISFADNSADQLLATDDDFLHGADDSIGPGNSGQDYLTLSQLTPKPRPRTTPVTVATPVSTMPRPRGDETRPIQDSKSHERTTFTRPKAVKRTPLATRKIELESATANITALAIDASTPSCRHPGKANEEILSGASASRRSDPADDDSILPTIGDNEALPRIASPHVVRSLRVKKLFKSSVSDIESDGPVYNTELIFFAAVLIKDFDSWWRHYKDPWKVESANVGPFSSSRQ
jgi:hypothetical protein